MLRLLCIRGARDVPCHAACSGRPHPYPTLARYRWALVPACCLLHGCITGDVPLLSSGEANFKYHKHHHEVGLLYRTIHKIHHLFANTLPIDSGK